MIREKLIQLDRDIADKDVSITTEVYIDNSKRVVSLVNADRQEVELDAAQSHHLARLLKENGFL